MTLSPNWENAIRTGASSQKRRNPMTWVDPVCAMSVEAPDSPELTFNGVKYRFCSEMCLRSFCERPGRYLKDGDNPYLGNLTVEAIAPNKATHKRDEHV